MSREFIISEGPATQRRVAQGLAELLTDAESHGAEHVAGVLRWAKKRVNAAVAETEAERKARAIGDPNCPAGYR